MSRFGAQVSMPRAREARASLGPVTPGFWRMSPILGPTHHTILWPYAVHRTIQVHQNPPHQCRIGSDACVVDGESPNWRHTHVSGPPRKSKTVGAPHPLLDTPTRLVRREESFLRRAAHLGGATTTSTLSCGGLTCVLTWRDALREPFSRFAAQACQPSCCALVTVSTRFLRAV